MTFLLRSMLVEKLAISYHIHLPPVSIRSLGIFGHPAKHYHSTARCPKCAQPAYDCLNCPAQSHTCASCRGSHYVFHRNCSANMFESEVALPRYKLGPTVQEARQEAYQADFLSLPTLILFSIPLLSPLSHLSLHLPQYLFPLFLALPTILPLSHNQILLSF